VDWLLVCPAPGDSAGICGSPEAAKRTAWRRDRATPFNDVWLGTLVSRLKNLIEETDQKSIGNSTWLMLLLTHKYLDGLSRFKEPAQAEANLVHDKGERPFGG
jgi:hypothetical protein